MIVTPQSNLQIMRGIPWTNDGKHTRYFTSPSDQNTYMQGHVVGTLQFSDFSYIREQNVLRVPIKADDLFNCNYLRYMNNGFGSKWFYAFITGIKYVNTEVSEISFEIDYFQTWWFDVQIGHCYVEREHVADDSVGLHVVEEDIGTGEIAPQQVYSRYWKYNQQGNTDFEKGMSLIVQVKPSLLGGFVTNQQPFDYVDNQIVPNTMKKSQPLDVADLKTELTLGTMTGAEISTAYMFPYELMVQPIGGVLLDEIFDTYNIVRPSAYKMSPSQYDNTDPKYIPKNNKLLTYPYTYLLVQSSDGHSRKYRWEDTEKGKVTFVLMGSEYNTPSCSLMPNNLFYKKEDRMNDVPITNFPQISVGQFNELKPQNLINGALGIIGSGITSFATGKPFGFISETAKEFTGLAFDTPDKDFATNGDSTLLRNNMFGYNFYMMGIYGQNAKIIDDYLTRFGYKVNCIKIPELHSRKRWNYVKTKECEMHARDGHGAPTDALQKIQDMFNAGVTLWHVNSVGDFTGDNGIRS